LAISVAACSLICRTMTWVWDCRAAIARYWKYNTSVAAPIVATIANTRGRARQSV